MFGYHGRLLRVDLTRRRVEIEDLDAGLVERYVGGAGIEAEILYRETSPDTDPLGPENLLMAVCGPYTGTPVPGSSRHHMMARSPLTGLLGEANVGGSWAVRFKKTGFDGIVITGKSEDPVYLWIHDGGVEFRDARHVWGKDSYESAALLKSQTSEKATVAVIGPAGERLARVAGIPHIGHIVRSAARTGLGAVMGSKNLKALVAYGTKGLPLARPELLQEDVKAALPRVRKATETFGKYGTSGGIENYEKIGNFPIKNWKQGRWAGASRISGVAMHDTILVGRRACFRCPIACGRHIRISEGPYAPLECEGPEYETLGTLGGECMVDDLAAICKANELCNRYGLDTISTGSIIAFAMEAYERGILTRRDTDGVDLVWGSGQALVEMVHKMGKREGIGELMGEGSRRMAEALGSNAVEFAVHVKGLEPSAHDPRRFFSQALSYGTAARGACHNASWSHPYELSLNMPEIGIPEAQDPYQIEGKAEFTAKLQNLMCMMDTLVICRFTQVGKAVDVTDMVRWLNLVTGWEVDIPGFMKTGDRVFNLKRLYNTRLGVSRKDDFLPPRFLTLKRTGEGLTNQLPHMGQLLADYYAYRGWSEEGVPTPEKLDELGLDGAFSTPFP
ncbi:MAG: aldehyde ferredoxin oxidoreductase family protein [Deltaproteobacteria bacterium]|nr:aldehyde ferredoxin oxidoreductase family protein [Deltaproteobacteria bacterium]